MSRILLAVAAVALSAPACFAAPAPPVGGKGTTFPYPAKAPIVICLNGYERVRDRLNKLLTAAVPAEAEKFNKLLDEQIDQFLEGRKLTAVRKDARVFVVLNDLAAILDGTPAASVLIPVRSHKQFLDSFLTNDELRTLDRGRDGVDAIRSAAFGEEMPVFLVDLKEYTAIALDRATADGYAAKYIAGTTEAMGSELAETFLKADLAVFVNMDQINEQFCEQIRAFKGLIDFGLQQAAQQGMLPGLGMRQLDAMKVLLQGAFQGVEDCQAIVLGAELRPEGLALQAQARFVENSPSAKWVASEASGPAAEISKLPAGLGVYYQTRFGKSVGELLRELNQEFVTTEDDERGAKLIEDHLKDRAAAEPLGEWSASTISGVSISVAAYTDAAKAHKAITKAFKAVAAGGRVNAVVVKTAPRVLDEAVQHRGFEFSEVRLNYDFEATIAALPDLAKEQALEALKRAHREKTDLWIGTNKKVIVTLIARDWDAAQTLLDRYLDGKFVVGASKGYKLTRSQLPDDATFLFVAETNAAVATLVDLLRNAGEVVPALPRLRPVKPVRGEPTFVGVAISLKGDIVSVNAFVPVGAMTVGRKLLTDLFRIID